MSKTAYKFGSYSSFVLRSHISLLIFSLTLPAWGQEVGTLEEIVVTAQRREQSLQDVPISLNVVSGEELSRQGYRRMEDMSAFIPALYIAGDSQNQGIMIRGVGTDGSNFGFEQAVPTFVDGVHYGRGSQIKGDFLDIERIEVLKGPQPVYFGQNASAGAISITTRKPGPVWEGRLLGEISSNGGRTIEIGMGGPMTDTLGIRIAAKYDSTDGHLTDIVTREKFPATKDIISRAIIRWTPNDSFNATLTGQYSQRRGGGPSTVWGLTEGTVDLTEGSSVLVVGLDGVNMLPLEMIDAGKIKTELGLRGGPIFFTPPAHVTRARRAQTNVIDLVPLLNTIDFAGSGKGFADRDESDPWSFNLEMNYTLPSNVVLTSQTAYSDYAREYVSNQFGSGGPFLLAPLLRNEHLSQWSQELRATSQTGGVFEWMAGLYYQNNGLDTHAHFWQADDVSGLQDNRNSDDSEWYSAFGTVTYNFMNDKMSLDVGGRYTKVEKFGQLLEVRGLWIVEGGGTEVTEHLMSAIGFIPPAPTGRKFESNYNDSDFSPQVVLRWRPTDDLSLYGKFAQAFKAGGFDSGVSSIPDVGREFEFDAEHATAWEIGGKQTFWDGRGFAELTLLWNEFDDLQLSAHDPTIGSNRTANAANQRVRGMEFSVRSALTEQLSMSLTGAVLDGEMVSFPGGICREAELDAGLCTGPDGTIDRSGQPAIRVPDWELVLNVDYWIPVMESLKLGFNAKGMASDGYIDARNFDQAIKMDTHANLSLSLGLADISETWELRVWGRNLLEPVPSYFPEFNIAPNGLISTRISSSQLMSYGIQASYSY